MVKEVKGINVFASSGNKDGALDVDFTGFDFEKSKRFVSDTVLMYLANQKKRTASVKTRGEVSYSTKKPWKQKGTGRARAGTKGSPIWVHGGVAFGPKPRDVYYDIPKKVRKKAIKESFLMKVRDDEVIIADVLDVNEPKTKLANDLLKRLNLSGSKVLMVTSKIKSNLILSIRNIKKVSVLPVNELNPMTIINAGKLVFEKEAYQEFEKNYLNK